MDGINDGNTEDWSVKLYRVARENGKEVGIIVGGGQLTDDQASLSNLAPGENTIFAVYYGYGNGYQIDGYSSYSNDVQVTNTGGPPAAPAAITATPYVNADGSEQMDIAWQNTPNNETSYVVQRSVNGGVFTNIATLGPDLAGGGTTTVASTGADKTTAVDKSYIVPGNTYKYRAKAVNSAGSSGWSPLAAAPAPVLGPIDLYLRPDVLGTDSTSTDSAMEWLTNALDKLADETDLATSEGLLSTVLDLAKKGIQYNSCQIDFWALVSANVPSANGKVTTKIFPFNFEVVANETKGPLFNYAGAYNFTEYADDQLVHQHEDANTAFEQHFNTWLDKTFPFVRNIAAYHISGQMLENVPKPPWQGVTTEPF
jgi:hypothetical protein